MPQLPSGRQIAIDPHPLLTLLNDTDNPAVVQKILAIDSIPKIKEWIEVTALVPAIEAGGNGQDADLATGSHTPPPGLVMSRTGTPLSKWESLAVDWSEDDKQAMSDFLIEPRTLDYLEERLVYVRQLHQDFLRSDNLLIKTNAAWWLAGVHPAQEQGYAEIWGDEDSPEWDTYDMLAALRSVVDYVVVHPETYELHRNTFDRASSMWDVLTAHYPFLRQHFSSEVSVREIASAWREERDIDPLPVRKQKWIYDQMVVECVNLWNHAGDTIAKCCPKAYAILTLVNLSEDGANCS